MIDRVQPSNGVDAGYPGLSLIIPFPIRQLVCTARMSGTMWLAILVVQVRRLWGGYEAAYRDPIEDARCKTLFLDDDPRCSIKKQAHLQVCGNKMLAPAKRRHSILFLLHHQSSSSEVKLSRGEAHLYSARSPLRCPSPTQSRVRPYRHDREAKPPLGLSLFH